MDGHQTWGPCSTLCCLLQDPPSWLAGPQSLLLLSSSFSFPPSFLKGSQPFSPAAAFKLRP